MQLLVDVSIAHLEDGGRVLVVNGAPHLHLAGGVGPAHRCQLQDEARASGPGWHAVQPHLQLGGVGRVDEAGPF